MPARKTILQQLARRYQRLRHRQKLALGFILLVLVFLLAPGVKRLANAIPFIGLGKTTLEFVNPPQQIGVGDPFTVELSMHSDSAVNAVGSVIYFNPRLVRVEAMSTEQSFCSFYADNAFDNIKGEIRISCGTPSPGFSGDSTIVQLQMRAKSVGTLEVTTKKSDSQVFANDGKGTNLLRQVPSFTTTIKQLL